MEEVKSENFIEEIILNDLKEKKYEKIITRFPPEPNGFLHLGHASSICLNFGLTKKFPGYTNLRFDDTNPTNEKQEYVDAIKNDIEWLGFKWQNELYASDYFDTLYDFATKLINDGLAYVDDLSSDEIAEQKGTHTQVGKNSPYRDRSVDENLKLFEEMKAGMFPDGAKTLRAKIDMSHPNMLMRDPIIYRIKHHPHPRTGDKWCIYPMYDFTHGQSDSIEEITHSVCTLEFVPHRELYDWFIEKLEIYPSKQYEFARRNINYNITSKRKLSALIDKGIVSGWDDPRMPTISGMRRRGFSPNSIRNFCDKIGIAKRENLVDMSLLEHCVREDLNEIAHRRMAVLNPINLVIKNYPEDKSEELELSNKPLDGSRKVTFSRNLWIEREDFKEQAEKKWFRLSPDGFVRLKGAYIIKCTGYDKDEDGNITEIRAEYFPESKSGQDNSGIKVKGVIHWLNQNDCISGEARIYDRLFNVEDPGNHEGDIEDVVNSDSYEQKKIYLETNLKNATQREHFQFIRMGYFILDTDSTQDNLIFNRTITLRDTWAKKSN